MQNNAKVAGVLSIISGAIGAFCWLIGTIFWVFLFRFIFSLPYDYGNPPPDRIISFIATFYSILGVVFILIGVLGIVGGVYALRKKYWGLSLAGAIAGTVVFFPIGIPAIIYTAMAKPDFATQIPPASALRSSFLGVASGKGATLKKFPLPFRKGRGLEG